MDEKMRQATRVVGEYLALTTPHLRSGRDRTAPNFKHPIESFIADSTGSLRVALWGDKADRNIEHGDELLLADLSIQEDFEGGTEGSANWNSSIAIIRKAADVPKRETEAPTEENSQATGLNEYDDESATDDRHEDTGRGGETIEITGTTLGTGDTATLEANDEQHTVVTDEELRLGQQATVRGAVKDGELHAEVIF
jgi:replication factor A1